MVNKQYQIIYADPPWHLKRGPMWNSDGESRPLPYPTMRVSDICSLDVESIAARDSHLYLWTVNKYIKDSFDVMKAWGFKFSCMITWCKSPHGLGLGGAFVQTTEHLLFGRRGSLPCANRIETTWFHHKRGRHSEKPDLFREIIIKSSGDLPRIELFARKKTPGWSIWGNEVESDIDLVSASSTPIIID